MLYIRFKYTGLVAASLIWVYLYKIRLITHQYKIEKNQHIGLWRFSIARKKPFKR